MEKKEYAVAYVARNSNTSIQFGIGLCYAISEEEAYGFGIKYAKEKFSIRKGILFS